MSHIASSPEEALARAQAVLDRLVPLTRAGLPVQPELLDHLGAAWEERVHALAGADRAGEAVAAADDWLRHLGDGEDAPGALPLERWPQVARALVAKGRALAGTGDIEAALAVLAQVQQRFEHAEALPVRQWLARAGLAEVNLRARHGATFAKVDMVRHAHRLATRFAADEWPATRALVAQLRRRRARLLAELDDPEEALSGWEALWRDSGASPDDEVREAAADGRLEQMRLLASLGRWSEALAAQRSLAGRLADTAHPGSLETLALAHLDVVLWWYGEDPEPPEGSTAQEQMRLACEAMEARFPLARTPRPALVDRCLSQCAGLHAGLLREQARRMREADGDAAGADALDEQARALAERLWADYADHPDALTRRNALRAHRDEVERRAGAPADRLAAWQAVLQRVGDDPAAPLQSPLLAVWTDIAFLQHEMQRLPEALATLEAAQRRFDNDPQPAVQRTLRDLACTRAHWLGDAGRFDEALALLDAPADEAPAEEEPDRWLQLLRLDTRAHLWAIQAPPVPDAPAEGEDPPAEVSELTPAEDHCARAVAAMAERFGADRSPRIRQRLAYRLYNLAVHQRERLHFEAARASNQRRIDLFLDDEDPEIVFRTASAGLNLGYLLMMLMGREEEALPVYDRMLERFGARTEPRLREVMAKLSASRLTCLNRLQRRGAEVSYGDAVEDLPLERRDALWARIDAARAHHGTKQYRQAVDIYDGILREHVASAHPELRRLCLDAMVNKGFCLGRLGQGEQALAVYGEVVERYGHESNTSAEKDVALALANSAVELDRLGRHDEEVAVYDRIVERWRDTTVDDLRMRVARALHAKGLTLADSDAAAAEAAYRETLARYLHAPEVAVRLPAAKAAVDLGVLLRRTGRAAEAASTCQGTLAQLAHETHPDFAEQLEKLRVQVARGHREAGQRDAAIAAYQALLDLPPKTLSETLLVALRREYAALGAARSWREKVANALIRLFHTR